MLQASIPTKFPIPWGNSASGTYIRTIPTLSQIGVQAGAASLTDGFPPVCFLPEGAGGTPAFGADFNGIFKQITQWLQWQQAGGTVQYDPTFQTSIGGYPAGAIVASATTLGSFWLSMVDNNVTNPDAGGAGWINPYPSTGDTKWRPTAEVLGGYVRMNSLTIGDPSSNSTERANNDTLAAFTWVFTNFSDAQCPLLTNVGGGTTRGSFANAAAAFSAHSQITLPDMRGRGPFGLDTMGAASAGRLAGGTFSSGNSSTAASVGGEAAHQLLLTEIPAHNHTATDSGHTHATNGGSPGTGVAGFVAATGTYTGGGGSGPQNQPQILNTGSGTANITVANSGGGGTHNTLPPFMLGTWYLKL